MTYAHRDEHMAIVAVDNVLVVGWLGPPGVEAATALDRTTRALAPRYPSGIAHLHVVTKTSSPRAFDDGARKRIVGLLHDPAIPLVASATVYGDGGFVAATIRGVLASLTMLSRSRVKLRFVSRVDEAEAFVLRALREADVHAPTSGLVAEAANAVVDDAVRAGLAF